MRIRSGMGNKTRINRDAKIEKVIEADRNASAKITEQCILAIANADVDEHSEIIEADVLTKDQANGNAKIQLASDYGVELKCITPEFVKQYSKPATRRAFRNVNAILAHNAKDMREMVSQRLPGGMEAIGDISQVSIRGDAPRMSVGLSIIEAILQQPLTNEIYTTPIEFSRDRVDAGLRECAQSLDKYKDFIKLEFNIDITQILKLSFNNIIQAVNRVAFENFGLKFSTIRGAKNKTTDKIRLGLDKSFTKFVHPNDAMHVRVRPIVN